MECKSASGSHRDITPLKVNGISYFVAAARIAKMVWMNELNFGFVS
jgi:hypothetical protein